METIFCKIEIFDETKKQINIIRLRGGAASRRLAILLARRGGKHPDPGLTVNAVYTSGRYDRKITAVDRFQDGGWYNYTFTGSMVQTVADFL